MSDDPFCEFCDVRLSLHSWPDESDPTERGCANAAMKAETLSMFGMGLSSFAPGSPPKGDTDV